MTLDEFFMLTPDRLSMGLEPYQREIIQELLSTNNNDYLKVADAWLQASPAQTAGFGGDPTKSNSKIYREKILEEIEKFICGTDDSYDDERQKISDNVEASEQVIVSIISAAIGAHLGLAGAYLAPIIVVLIMSFGKIGRNAWCSMRKDMKAQSSDVK